MKALLDSNVIIDALSHRKGAAIGSQEVLISLADGTYEGCLASKQVTDIYYSLRKYVDQDTRERFIRLLLRACTILPVGKKELEDAFSLGMRDYEDAVLCEVAQRNDVSTIVTNNAKDFESSSLSILSPEEFLKTLPKE